MNVICVENVLLHSVADLKVHERTHNGEKPFQCKFCKKSFAQRTTFKFHEIVHTGDKPFKCKNCDKGFRNPFNLKQHEDIIHAGKKLYECDTCKKHFYVQEKDLMNTKFVGNVLLTLLI